MNEYKISRQVNQSPSSQVVFRIHAVSVGLASRAADEMVYAMRWIAKKTSVTDASHQPDAWAIEAVNAKGTKQTQQVFIRYSGNSDMNVNVGGRVYA